MGGRFMQILQGKRIKKIYGDWDNSTSTTALRGIDISIEGMDFIGVMGPSGSGKTTLLNILGGIIKPTSGTVEIGGIDVTDMTKDELALFRRKRLGFDEC
jgi:putative ABC transport system ATP-binding protein